MKIIQAVFHIKGEHREAFLAETNALMTATRQEAGCLEYHLYESIEVPNQFVMVEKWADETAIAEHNKSELLQALFLHMKDYAAKETVLTVAESLN